MQLLAKQTGTLKYTKVIPWIAFCLCVLYVKDKEPRQLFQRDFEFGKCRSGSGYVDWAPNLFTDLRC